MYNGHLSIEEIEQLSQHKGAAENQSHAENCRQCQALLEKHRTVSAKLDQLASVRIGAKNGMNCPDERIWFDVAAGTLSSDESSRYAQHAVECESCAQKLRAATRMFQEELSPEEEKEIAALPSASARGQKRLAQTLTGKPSLDTSSARRKRSFWWPVSFSLAGAAAVAAVVFFVWPRNSPADAEKLLAQAYTERRTIEPRLAGAQFAPLRMERGPNSSNLEKPPSLLKAEALIATKLNQTPDDPAWLEVKARADLLDGNYDSAIKSLQHALKLKPQSTGILTDLGSAYFERAEFSKRTSDYGDAIEDLSQALAIAPDDPVALFNRALVYERMFLPHEAVKDWEHYLVVDAKGGWSEEARQHLTALQKKLGEHDSRMRMPLLTPANFVANVNEAEAQTWLTPETRIEDYLDLAVRDWLPTAFPADWPDRHEPTTSEAHAALHALAKILADRHRDLWLSDLLDTPVTTDFVSGVQSLADAARENASGNPDVALRDALSAKSAFGKSSSSAGKLLAQFEEIYALHRQSRSVACLDRIPQVAPLLRNGRYPWLNIQTSLERYACQSSAEVELGTTGDSLSFARLAAERAHYGTLHLRALGFSASREAEMGSFEAAWRIDRLGLEEYWSGHYPALRAQHFYDGLSLIAQDSGKWFLAVALGREAVLAIAATPNRTGEGMERIELARSAGHAGLWQEAAVQYSQALEAFSSLPTSRSTQAFRAHAEIGMAEADLALGRRQSADARLQYARSNLPMDFEEYQTWAAMYRTTGELRLLQGDRTGARNACLAAVLIAEIGLRSIHTEIERLRWNRTTSACYQQVVEWALTRGQSIEALELWEWYLGFGLRPASPSKGTTNFADMDKAVSAPSLKKITDLAPTLAGETVIVYADLGDRVVAWIYDDRGIFWRSLAVTSSELNPSALEFLAQCADPRSDIDALRAVSNRLYNLMIAPISSYLDPSRTLVFEVDGDLSAIPFAALLDNSGRYLIDMYALVYLPGASYRPKLRSRSPVSRQDFALVVGDPTIPEFLRSLYMPLPDAVREAEQVSQEFSRSALLTGAKATTNALVEYLSNASVFHFAGHAISEPGYAALILAGSPAQDETVGSVFEYDRLRSQDVPHLRLAVLSACSTERGTGGGAHGADSLVRSFLRSGVPEVVATRWEVNSAATAAFMGLFYGDLLSHGSLPAALARSMGRMRLLSRYSHPYYWAGFDAFGRGSEVSR